MNKSKPSTTVLGSCGLGLAIAVGSPASAQEAPAPGAAGQAAVAELGEVIVSGIRVSIAAALEEKRNTDNLVEIIKAEDIGKLPDENVAEVLENLPGVQIDRNAGIGSAVSIRGSNENNVEIDGRATTAAESNRGGISFSDLPSELVESLVVVKVPTSDMIEGSLGGSINVRTRRPLELKKPITSARAVFELSELSDEYNENLSGTLARRIDTDLGRVGFVVTATQSNKTVREDSLRVSPGVTTAAASTIDFDGNGTRDAYYKPGFGDLRFGTEKREGKSLTGAVGWQATDTLKLFADATYTEYEDINLGQSAFIAFPSSDFEIDDLDTAEFDSLDIEGISVPVMTYGLIGAGCLNGRIDAANQTPCPRDGAQIRVNNQSERRTTETYLAALGGEWQRDALKVEFEASFAGSDTQAPAFALVFQLQDPARTPFHNANSLLRVPFVYDNRGDVLAFGPVPGSVTDSFLLNPANYSLFTARDTESFFDNEETAQRVDFTWDIDGSFLRSMKFGIRLNQRSNERTRESQVTANFPGFSGAQLQQYLAATPGDFFSFYESGVYLDNFLTPDPDGVVNNRQQLRELLRLSTEGVPDLLQGFKVREYTSAGYVRFDYGSELFGLPFRGNVGVRLLHTNQNAAGDEVLPGGIVRPVSETQKYTKALPSFSFVLKPVDDVQVRLGYAKVLRRPNFGDLSPTVQFPLNNNPVTVGNPQLKPTTAEQYDLSLEWYFAKGSVLSVGYFYKDISATIGNQRFFNAICNPRGIDGAAGTPTARPLCTTSDGLPGILVDRVSPANLAGGTIEGYEAALQHNFDWLPSPFDGLGVLANFTYQDGQREQFFTVPAFLTSQGADPRFPLNFVGLSEESYNVTAFYEKYGFGARVRYTYRDTYLVSESIDIANGNPLYREGRGQLQASLSYDVNKWLSLQLNGTNLTAEPIIEPGTFPTGPTARAFSPDRRYSFGITAKF